MAGAGAGEGARSGVVAQWLAERRFGFVQEKVTLTLTTLTLTLTLSLTLVLT